MAFSNEFAKQIKIVYNLSLNANIQSKSKLYDLNFTNMYAKQSLRYIISFKT